MANMKTMRRLNIHIEHITALFGILIFVSYSILLILEYAGLPMMDTCLFYLGGESVGLQGHVVVDLSPLYVGVIYFICLAAIILVRVTAKTFAGLYIVNALFAVLLLLFYIPYLPDYPPIGHTECFVVTIFLTITLSYLSIIFSFLFGGYFLYKKCIKRISDNQMKL